MDENNNPIESRPRDEAHSKGLWHRNSHVWIINSRDEILCQKRSLKKDSNPGFWEPFFGGHLKPNQEYLESAVQEVNEELGLSVRKKDLTLFKIFKDRDHKEFQSIFKILWYGDISKIKFDKDEVEELKLLPISEVKDTLLTKKNYKWTIIGYETEFFEWLEKG